MRLKGSSPSSLPVLSYMGSPDGSIVGGIPGRAATVTVGTTTTGSAGSSASVVNSGSYSEAVLDFTVPRGTAVTVGSTTTGLPGSSAAVSNSGTVDAAVLNFTIPRGDVGPQGSPGTPGSVTVAGLGDATTIGRLVCTTASSGAINDWAKVATFSCPTVGHPVQLLLAFNLARTNLGPVSAIVSAYVTYGSATASSAGQSGVEILAASARDSTTGGISADSFKIVSGGYGTPFELWFKTTLNLATVAVSELGRRITNASNSVTYHDGATWQSTEPVGAVTNAVSAGVEAFGVPVVTTTGTATLTNKTLTSPTITSPRVNQILDSNGPAILTTLPASTPVNSWAIANSNTGSSLAIYAMGSDTNINAAVFGKGTGTISLRGSDTGKILDATPVASGVNFVNVTQAATSAAPSVAATGTDANVSLNLVTKGSGTVQANGIPVVTTTGSQALTNKTLTSPTITNPVIESLNGTNGTKALHLAADVGAVNYLQVSGKPAGNPIYVSAKGGDSDVSMYVNAKGVGKVLVGNDLGTGFSAVAVASSVNRVEAAGSATGSAPSLSTLGSDTNIDLNLVAKGTGVVKANGNPVGVRVAVPSSPAATGASGQWAANDSHLFVCIASGNWRRHAFDVWT